MYGLQTFIALFGGKEYRDRKLYSLTYGELRSIYFRYLIRKLIVMGILIAICISMFMLENTNNGNGSTQTIEKPASADEMTQEYPGIGSAKDIQRKSWK